MATKIKIIHSENVHVKISNLEILVIVINILSNIKVSNHRPKNYLIV